MHTAQSGSGPESPLRFYVRLSSPQREDGVDFAKLSFLIWEVGVVGRLQPSL